MPVATVRARDRAEVRTGVVLDLGLASPKFGSEHLGDFLELQHVRAFAFRGFLSVQSLIALLPKTEWTAPKAFGPNGQLEVVPPRTLVVVDEIDERALGACLSGTDRQPDIEAVLTPSRLGHGVDAFARTFGVSIGTLEPELKPGTIASGFTVVATPHAMVCGGYALPGDGPVGLLFLGGDDLSHARARARVARDVLKAS
ncbi:MAG: hypothetical protein JST54_31955 [Deltaproteobacteria bacterium]|nr:hypothetical protein [Deltaproteobacteria bacterium]